MFEVHKDPSDPASEELGYWSLAFDAGMYFQDKFFYYFIGEIITFDRLNLINLFYQHQNYDLSRIVDKV